MIHLQIKIATIIMKFEKQKFLIEGKSFDLKIFNFNIYIIIKLKRIFMNTII